MNKTVDRTSNQDELYPQDHFDDYFQELCAASTSGALTAEEWKQLELHLSICGSCRKLKAEYDAVIATTLPAMAAACPQPDDDDPSDPQSFERAEASLMERIERENISPEAAPHDSRGTARWSLPWPYAGAALFIVGSSLIGYYFGISYGHHTSAALPLAGPPARHATTARNGTPAFVRPVERTDGRREAAEVTDLRNQLRARLAEIAVLHDERASLQNELAVRNVDLDHESKERADLAEQLARAETSAQSLQDKLDLAGAQATHEAASTGLLQMQVSQLTAELDKKDQLIAQRDQLLEHDRDIRNLIGARDLLINDVYDVARTGKTQKPFGRVFYTKGKSLIFYAYDLDQQPGVKLASTFQVWGSKGVDQEHAIDLGILYQDDHDKKRWILKSNDPETLAQLDAVFVTLEPHGASAKPTGKPLLFTYLRLSSNHP